MLSHIIWIYYLLNKEHLFQLDYPSEISLTFDEIIEGFAQPTFLCLHGSKGAPSGCINPRDASYWKMIEQGINPEDIQLLGQGEVGKEVYAYSRTRWYAFTLNGLRLVAQLLFALTLGCTEVVLCIRNRFGLIDLIYDSHEEFDVLWEPPERSEWSSRVQKLLGDKAKITEYGYELWVPNANTLVECGIIYEISPFEGEYTMWDMTSGAPRLLWRGFGIREDYCDLCLCFESINTKLMFNQLQEFCNKMGIKLLYCTDWNPKIEVRDAREVFPPPGCVEIT
jgi:hypothetical protein